MIGVRYAVASLAWTLLGLGLGLLLHPYFPRNVEFAFFHLLPKAVPAEQAAVTVGQEWYPYSLNGFIVRAGPSTALTLLGLVPIVHQLARRRWPDWRTLVLGILALGFLAMVARSQRLIEYYPAFAVIFCAWSWSHAPATIAALAGLARFSPVRPHVPDGRRFLPVLPWLAAIVIAPFIVTSTLIASREADDGVGTGTPTATAPSGLRETPRPARASSPPAGTISRTCSSGTPTTPTSSASTPPTRRSKTPSGTSSGARSHRAECPRPSRAIREHFGALYILSDHRHERFLQVAAADPGLEPVLRTRTVVIYRVRGG